MKVLISAALMSLMSFATLSFAQVPNRDELAAKYPDIEEGSLKPENKKILCPFHRMLERAGLYDAQKNGMGPLTVRVIQIAAVAKEFGCKVLGCASVTGAVSAGQVAKLATFPGHVNLEALHRSLGFSHECGLTFSKGATEVSDAYRRRTLAALASLADEEGRLTLDDLNTVKEAICEEQGVRNDLVQKTEVKLLFNFLGGNERGFVDLADVERFFFAELPKTIAAPDAF